MSFPENGVPTRDWVRPVPVLDGHYPTGQFDPESRRQIIECRVILTWPFRANVIVADDGVHRLGGLLQGAKDVGTADIARMYDPIDLPGQLQDRWMHVSVGVGQQQYPSGHGLGSGPVGPLSDRRDEQIEQPTEPAEEQDQKHPNELFRAGGLARAQDQDDREPPGDRNKQQPESAQSNECFQSQCNPLSSEI